MALIVGERATGDVITKNYVADAKVPRGRPVSGRVWKNVRTARHSSLVKVQSLRSDWATKMKGKADLKSVKNYHKELKDRKQKDIEHKKELRRVNIKRKEEKEKMAEIVQKVKSKAKLARTKKKLLRYQKDESRLIPKIPAPQRSKTVVVKNS